MVTAAPVALLIHACLVSLAHGAPPIPVPQTTEAFQLDGVASEDCWKKAPSLNLTRLLGGAREPSVTTAVRTLLTDRALFFFFDCQEPHPQRLLAKVKTSKGDVWTDDSVEIFLAPDDRWPDQYYHLVINTLAVVLDEFWSKGSRDLSWKSGAKAAVCRRPDGWTVEVEIPLQSLNRVPILSDRWALQFARNRYTGGEPELITWMPARLSYHEPSSFASVCLSGVVTLPVVRRVSQFVVNKKVASLVRVLRGYLAKLDTNGKPSVVRLRQELQSRLDKGQGLRSLEEKWNWVRVEEMELDRREDEVRRASIAGKLGQPYAVFVLPPTEKLRCGDLPQEPWTQEVVLHCARGEGESAQVVVAALERELRVRFAVSPLIGPNGFVIFPQVRQIGFVPVKRPTPGGFGKTGRYPDPLLPLPAEGISFSEGETGGIWVTVRVPPEAPPGLYEGAIEIRPEGVPKRQIRMRAQVYGVTLPNQSSLKTCVLIWDHLADRIYGPSWTEERRRRFYETCLRYRFTPPPPLPWDQIFVKGADGKWQARWDEFDREVEGWMKQGATAFSIGGGILRWGTQPPPPDQQDEAGQKLRLLSDHIRSKGWTGRFYFYVFDEPSASEWDNIRALASFVKEKGPDLPLILTAGYGATGAYRTHAPTPEGAAYRGLEGAIGIWVPHIDCFDEPFLSGRRKAADEVWMYVCISTVGKSYPDVWRIDWTGTAHRAIGWWLWKYGCQGFLYWCVNYWADDKGPFDLWSEPVAYPGGNGDGFLFYPDPNKGDPIPSVRAEVMRDGFEDYDLLQMLAQRVKKKKLSATLARSVERLLKAEEIITGPDRFSHNSADYIDAHRLLLKTLEALGR